MKSETFVIDTTETHNVEMVGYLLVQSCQSYTRLLGVQMGLATVSMLKLTCRFKDVLAISVSNF